MPSVRVYEGQFDKALRKFKKKVSDSGILDELRKRQMYEKPSTVRNRKKGAAISRHKKQVRKDNHPPKYF